MAGFDLSAVIGSVSGLDTATGSGTLTMIPAAQVHPNPLNFYDVSDVDSLIDAILMDGLQSPIVVNRLAADNYEIISGHRRYAALTRIIEKKLQIRKGKLFAADIGAGNIPCLVNVYDNAAQAELALIRANSDSRELSSAEKSKQVERVEMLIYQLKEQGYEFPGKMRDYVAEACNVSASKIARLKVIRGKLADVWKNTYKSGALNETAAYELAKLDAPLQERIKRAYSQDVGSLATYKINDYSQAYEQMKKIGCKYGETECTNFERMWARYTEPHTYHNACRRCCKECNERTNCKAVCPKFRDKILEEKRKEWAKNKAAKDTEAKRVAAKIANIQAYWTRFGTARREAGVELPECFELMGLRSYTKSDWYISQWKEQENGLRKLTQYEHTPYDDIDLKCIAALAERFGCSMGYLLCVSDKPAEPVGSAGNQVMAWRHDAPPTKTMIVGKVSIEDYDDCIISLLNVSYDGRTLYFDDGSCEIINGRLCGWYPLPEE